MENLVDNSIGGNEFGLNERSIAYLNETRKWSLFMSILGLIVFGLLIIGVFVMLVFMGDLMGGFNLQNGSPNPAMGLIPFALIMVVWFFPIYFLLQFAINSKKALINKDNQSLERGFKFLNFHFRYIGIVTIIIIAIYAILGTVALAMR